MAFKFNPLTGLLDLVNPPASATPTFDPNTIVTHERNGAGTKLMGYDPASGTHVEMAAQVVIDNNGNVVTAGG
ncbi:hypothetical protein UFOVP53_63 [uncultured Caudovirales phage]|uniref:Uncharacterized protein n=1 Tax=uncultured Caudovirales phage TaxID=2100421 RepID=A0A6J5KRQ4_9CAUD|nr:hypothetical protein UFOVP53_63 [uncultured Caudovirales phage]